MPGSTGGGWKRSDLATVTGVAQPTGKPAEDRPQALPSGTATAPALDPTILPAATVIVLVIVITADWMAD